MFRLTRSRSALILLMDRHAHKPKFFAFGLTPLGIISIGVVPMGVFSIGVVPMGVFSLGTVAMGVISAGAVSMGGIAAGVQTMGIISIGSQGMGNVRIPLNSQPAQHQHHEMPDAEMPMQMEDIEDMESQE
ncbi:MAG: hypothetical protein ACLFT0_11955 [Spirulinaceae cyanobacterium]